MKNLFYKISKNTKFAFNFSNSVNLTKNNFSSLNLPIKDFNSLDDINSVKSYRNLLKNKSGIYAIINNINNKQYIGSAKDLYLRLLEHISGKKSNSALQIAIEKYNLGNFTFRVLEYICDENKLANNKKLTDLETEYIAKFDFKNLYNFKKISTSMLGYKHTEEALLKMIERFKIKKNHPMFGKTHTDETKNLISKPGEKNPMFGKNHTEATKALISKNMKKYPFGVGIYDLNYNLIKNFNNNAELARYFNVSKTTIGKYIKTGKLFNNIYYLKINKV